MQIQPIFETAECDMINYYYFENGLSQEEIQKVFTSVEKLPYNEALVAGDGKINKEIRSSNVKWIPKNDGYGWLYFKLMELVDEANKNLWNFNLYSVIENIQYTEYHATQQGHYGWHQDVGGGSMSKRKVSMVVQLSDPSEYEGGELQFFKGGNPENAESIMKKKGFTVIFPSYIMHRVTPITQGVRKSLVLWLGGEHYK
jgi:PKHD-type hydroxylase